MMTISLLGAGHIGRAISRLLLDSGDFRLTVYDHSEAALAQLAADAEPGPGLSTRPLDATDPTALLAALQGQDAVINALPYDQAVRVAAAARQAGCHYFDLTEDVAATRAIQQLAEGAATAFMPQCGLAPGFVGIVAHDLAQRFEVPLDIQLRVGALPAFPTNALKYNLTWSVDGLINEYSRPCDTLRDGRPFQVLPLEGLEHFSLDGTEYEAFNTSGGLGTLCQSLAGRVRSLDYKSVRYPGHQALMKVLMEDLRLAEDPQTLKTLLRKAIPATMQDVVLVFVTANGLRHGALVQEVFVRKVFADRREGKAASAIQLSTAAGVCTVLDLFRQGRLPTRGFIRQEQAALPDFMANRFARAYGQHRQVASIG